MDALGALIISIIVLLVAAGAYFAYVQQKKRREEMALLAGELGWRFVPDKDYAHDDQYAHFEIFRQGHSRFAYNTLFGSLAVGGSVWPAKMGDYHYQITTSNGKSTTTHTYRFSYLIVELPYRGLPELLIRREGMFDSVKNLFGFDDIDFESAEFSRRFFVKSPNKRFAYDVIHAGMMEFFLATDAPTVDVENGRCCVSDGKRTWSADQFRAKMEWVREFFERWPNHVTNQLEHKS